MAPRVTVHLELSSLGDHGDTAKPRPHPCPPPVHCFHPFHPNCLPSLRPILPLFAPCAPAASNGFCGFLRFSAGWCQSAAQRDPVIPLMWRTAVGPFLGRPLYAARRHVAASYDDDEAVPTAQAQASKQSGTRSTPAYALVHGVLCAFGWRGRRSGAFCAGAAVCQVLPLFYRVLPHFFPFCGSVSAAILPFLCHTSPQLCRPVTVLPLFCRSSAVFRPRLDR